MKLTEIESGKNYKIEDFGNMGASEIEMLNEIGFIEGEELSKSQDINCVDSVCMFSIENTNYSINKKYVETIEVSEVK